MEKESRSNVWIWVGTVALALAVIGVVLFLFLLKPYQAAETAMPQDTRFELLWREGKPVLLTWQEVPGVDEYSVEVIRASDGVTVLRGSVATAGCNLSDLPDTGLILRVNSRKYYQAFGQKLVREGSTPVEASFVMGDPRPVNLRYDLDDERDTVTLTWGGTSGSIVRIYGQTGGERTLIREFNGTETTLSFDGTDFPILERDDEATVFMEVGRDYPNVTIRSEVKELSFRGEDFIGDRAFIRVADQGNSFYTLTWGETKGDTYEVQTVSEYGIWKTVATLSASDERKYETGHLPPFTDHYYRIISSGGGLLEEGKDKTVSEETTISTGVTTVYATVWPLQALNLWKDTAKSSAQGKVPQAEALCVLGEENGLFYVRYGDNYGYIDSNYCMINLPDYMGSMCSYDITNSYFSIYKIHDYGITDVTGTVITGYEHVSLPGSGYLVPLLYPAAKKLVDAAQSARESGYTLKIYDSFRPRSATLDIYNKTSAILDTYVPRLPWDGRRPSDMPGVAIAPDRLANQPVEEGKDYLTFRTLMMGGAYSLNSFLAAGASRHNYGVALDLTLERVQDGRELTMQTALHDLSQYSVTGRNTGNAKTLKQIMMSAGFGDLSTEWWHFQDNDAYDKLGLTAMQQGVSPEGWVKDDTGWRFRQADGYFIQDETQTVGGKEYTFDRDGYTER